MCDIYDVLKMHFLGTAAHMSVGYMGIIRGCFSFPYVDGGRISGWQEQAGKAGGVLAPLSADTVSAFCRALIKMRMATHTEHRFWGENISSCGCQWYKRGKRFIEKSLSIFQKWKLTVLKQKREWDLSISSGNRSWQKERCQMGLPNSILLEVSVVSREGEESKRLNGSNISWNKAQTLYFISLKGVLQSLFVQNWWGKAAVLERVNYGWFLSFSRFIQLFEVYVVFQILNWDSDPKLSF